MLNKLIVVNSIQYGHLLYFEDSDSLTLSNMICTNNSILSTLKLIHVTNANTLNISNVFIVRNIFGSLLTAMSKFLHITRLEIRDNNIKNGLYHENSIRYQEPTNLIKIFADTTIHELNFIGNFLQSNCPMNLISFGREGSKLELSAIQKSTLN
jgi:hypothetical protein